MISWCGRSSSVHQQSRSSAAARCAVPGAAAPPSPASSSPTTAASRRSRSSRSTASYPTPSTRWTSIGLPPSASPSSNSTVPATTVASPCTPPATGCSCSPSPTNKSSSTSATRPRGSGPRSPASPALTALRSTTIARPASTASSTGKRGTPRITKLSTTFTPWGPPRSQGASKHPRLVETGWFHPTCRPGVFFHGCIHWLLHGSPEKALVVFDTAAESFRTVPSPIAADSWTVPQLLVMDASLAVSSIDRSQTMMKLWVLQDYEAGVWSLRRRVIFPKVEMWSVVKGCRRFIGTVASQDGDVLLYCLRSSHLFHSGGKGELAQTLCWSGVFPVPTGHWFRESLVRHEFFQRQDDGARARRQPRFFRGI